MITRSKIELLSISALIFSILFFIIVVFTSIPLGIPKDWIWTRITEFYGLPFYELIAIVIFLIVSVLCALKIDFRIARLSNKLFYLLLIIFMSMLFDYYVLLSGRAGIVENVFAVIDPFTSGYLMVAGKIEEPDKYFANFEKVLEKDAYESNHIDVHPPGNIAFCYAVLEWCRKSSTPSWLIEKLLPDNVMRDVREAGKNKNFHGVSQGDALYTAAAMIVLIFLAMNFLSRAILVTALLVMTKGCSRNLGLNTLFVGFTISAVILFLGHHDIMMFFIGAVCTLFLCMTIRCEWRKFPVFSILTGIALGIGVIHTLAFAMFIFAAVITIFFCCVPSRYTKIIALIGGGLIVVVVCMSMGIDIIAMCLLASRNNSRFFVESGRCWYWFPFNLLDFMIFVGPFLALLPVVMLPKLKMFKSLKFAPVQALALACVVTLFILLVSPFSRGEMGRLMLFFMPIYSLSACLSLSYNKLSDKTYFLCIFNAMATVSLLLALRLTLKLVVVF